MDRPFRASLGASTFAVNAATGANPIAFNSLVLSHGSGFRVRVRNVGNADAYIAFGDAAPSASVPVAGVAPAVGTPGSMGVGAGKTEFFTCQQLERMLAVAFGAGATPLIEVTIGEGGY